MDFDITLIRDFTIQTNPGRNFDIPYTFYYDETNNIRKFSLLENGFNSSFQANFVLGGVVFEGPRPDPLPLFDGLGIPDSAKEIKLRHIAKGNFAECLTSNRLATLLNRIIESPFYLHYSSLNILYWSLVDIIDSAVANAEWAIREGPAFGAMLKDTVYSLCKRELDKIIPLFFHFNYPNIEPKDILSFVDELMTLFKPHERELYYKVRLDLLKKLFSESKDSLPFIMDEESHILIREFSMFHSRPTYLFLNSIHIFDNEDSIRETLAEYRFLYNGTPIENHRFDDSRNDLLIQLSDVLIGFVGKFFIFINTHTSEEIEYQIREFSPTQIQTFDVFLDLIGKSDSKNPLFLHGVDALEETKKLRLIYRLRNKI